ncbi:hypothetical protein HaLaN_15229 [Haematococcus lacustris]|uniref:Uncharacterized protein n=1 Tax=Haematococcus lacustris TaxID=44745 RepID=A0A699ZHU6_HAELA|nr:hypothetical protein HaLaN_15229 [Haematococcus lacustris]
MTFAASSPLELDVKRRNILGLRAGCGALFACSMLGMMQLGVQPAQWLSAWFKGADVTSLGRNDVAELVATSIWHASKQEVEDAGHGSHLQSMTFGFYEENTHLGVAAQHRF